MGECDRSRPNQEGGETGADAELALTLARLVDALVFCDNCHSSGVKARSQATLETAAEGRASSRDEMEYGQTDGKTGSERETGAIQSEVLIAEVRCLAFSIQVHLLYHSVAMEQVFCPLLREPVPVCRLLCSDCLPGLAIRHGAIILLQGLSEAGLPKMLFVSALPC